MPIPFQRHPETQPVSGEVSVSNFPAVQPVSDNDASLTVDGSVSVSNLPAVQPVNDNGGSLTVDGTVDVNNFPAVQVISGEVTELCPKRLVWDTTADWNRGVLGTDVEVSGSGKAAVIRPNTEAIPAPDTYLTWELNETEGTVAADSSLNGRDGTLMTVSEFLNPSLWITGKLGNAWSNPGEYEAVNYITGGDIAAFEWNQPFSIECWQNHTPGYDVTIAGNYNATDQKGWVIGIQEDYLYFKLFGDASTNFLQTYSSTKVTTNTWQHLVITYDGSGVEVGVKFYLDGVLLINSPYWDGLAETSTVPTTNEFKVGALIDTGWAFIGQIDSFSLYTTVLTQTDVDFKYNTGTGTEFPLVPIYLYKTTAHYETDIYDSKNIDQLWEKVSISKSTPTTTTPAVKASGTVTFGTPDNASAPIQAHAQIRVLDWTNISGAINNIGEAYIQEGYHYYASTSNEDTAILIRDAYNAEIAAYPGNLIVASINPINANYVDFTAVDQIGTAGNALWIDSDNATYLPVYGSNTNHTSTHFYGGSNSVTGSTITVDGNTFNKVASTPSTNEFVTISDLTSLIDGLSSVNATDDGFIITIEAATAGIAGNSITLAQTGAGLALSGSTLTGGIDEVIIPSTTAVIKARASNNSLVMGSYGPALTTGTSISITGQYIQFSVDFTGTVLLRASVDSIGIDFISNPVCEVHTASEPVKVTETEYKILIERNIDGSIKYFGEAIAGSSLSQAVWKIRKFDYTSSFLTSVTFADSSNEFNKVWNNRSGYTYA